jgi:preprotein translocase subunit SecA
VIDNRWREHLFDMDYLREGIHLRGFAQIDPLVAYKNEGFTMFEDLMHSIWEEFSKLVFHAEIEFTEAPGGNGRQPYEGGGFEAGTDRRALEYSGGTGEAQPSALEGMAAGVQTGPMPTGGPADAVAAQQAGPANDNVVETVVKDEHENIGRNDPCWCGSGKKYKKCHGA